MSTKLSLTTYRIFFSCSLALIFSLIVPQVTYANSGTTIFLPVAPTDDSLSIDCTLNAHEQDIADLMSTSAEQGRPELHCNTILSQVARERAQDMATRGYFDHTNPDGLGPNYLVAAAGYVLPSYYNTERHGNNIESIGAGYATAEDVWEAWKESSKHRRHLLAEGEFYEKQIEYGIGFVEDPDSQYRYYWVVITAEPGS